jgi:hypothetical protein
MKVVADSAHIYDPEIGHFVSSNHSRVAAIIQDYDPTLFLVWIPPNKREMNEEFPFAIMHRPKGKPSYVVRRVRESEVNAGLIAWLFMNDQARQGKDILGRLEAYEQAMEAMRLKKQMEQREETKDIAASILGGKHWYRHNGIVYS